MSQNRIIDSIRLSKTVTGKRDPSGSHFHKLDVASCTPIRGIQMRG